MMYRSLLAIANVLAVIFYLMAIACLMPITVIDPTDGGLLEANAHSIMQRSKLGCMSLTMAVLVGCANFAGVVLSKQKEKSNA